MVIKRKVKETDQTKLVEYYENSNDKLFDGLTSLNRLIPSSQTTTYTHGIHRYVAKFMPQYPNLIIRLLSKENEIVLDPMCGSGTTLIEALLNGRQALGIDIDPLSRLISKVVTTPLSEKKIQNLFDWWKVISKNRHKIKPKNYDLETVPNHKIWFRDDVLASIFYLRGEINKIKDKDSKDAMKIALSKIIKQMSNADPRDAMPEINHEHPINEEADVFDSFSQSFEKTLSKISKFTKRIKSFNGIKAKIVGTDARKIKLDDNSVDLIMTSPPYAYAMDYGRIHKLNMFTVLGISGNELRELSREYVGTDRVSVNEEIKFVPELDFTRPFLDKLSRKNKRRALSLKKYILDMYKITQECVRVLKPNGYFVYVIGNSTLAKNEFSNVKLLQKMGELLGLETRMTHERPYYMRTMGKKRASHSAVTKSDVFIIFRKGRTGGKKI